MNEQVFELIRHESGVYEMMFYISSRQAVDASVAAVDELLSQRGDIDNNPLLLMSNNSISGDEPIAYATNAYRKLVQKHGMSQLRNSYLALIYQEGMMMSFWVTLLSSFRMPVRMRSFPEDQYDDALRWLVEESQAVHNH
jgi:hypothetical protein